MSDKYKGLIITFREDVKKEYIETVSECFKNFNFVADVNPLIKNFEDYMAEEKGRMDMRNEMMTFLMTTFKKNKKDN